MVIMAEMGILKAQHTEDPSKPNYKGDTVGGVPVFNFLQ